MTPARPGTEKPLCAERSERLAVPRLNAGGEGKSADTGSKGLTGHHWRGVNSLCQAQRLPWGASLWLMLEQRT